MQSMSCVISKQCSCENSATRGLFENCVINFGKKLTLQMLTSHYIPNSSTKIKVSLIYTVSPNTVFWIPQNQGISLMPFFRSTFFFLTTSPVQLRKKKCSWLFFWVQDQCVAGHRAVPVGGLNGSTVGRALKVS